jgi:hypothetical protein
MMAIAFARRRVFVLGGDLFSKIKIGQTFEQDIFDFVTEDAYNYLRTAKKPKIDLV